MHRVLSRADAWPILEFAIPDHAGVRARLPLVFQPRAAADRAAGLAAQRAYGYLPASVGAFASPDEFVKILRQSGFDEIHAVPLTFGIVYLYTARRR